MNRQFGDSPDFKISAEKTSLSDDQLFAWIEQIVSFGPRKPASDGDRKTRAFIGEKFKESGLLDAGTDPVAVETSKVYDWSLSLRDNQTGEEITIPTFYIPFSAPTCNRTDEAPVVYIGDGTDIDQLDLKGKVTVFEQKSRPQNWDMLREMFFSYDPAGTIPEGYQSMNLIETTEREIHDKIVPRGAVGMVGLLSDLQWESNTFCPQMNHGTTKEIPGYWVSPTSSVVVKTWLSRGDVTAKMSLAAEQDQSTTYNIYASLPGQVDQYYVIMCHHDAPFANAVQDASGVSVVLALANHFSTLRNKRPLRRGVIFLAVGGHTLGRLGEKEFVSRHRDGLLHKVAFVISVEHIAKEFVPGRNLAFDCSRMPSPRMFLTSQNEKLNGIVKSCIIHNAYGRSIIIPQWVVKQASGKARGISGEFYEAEIPVVGLLSYAPYMFFMEDTPATVARDQLVPTVDMIISIVRTADALALNEFR